MCGFGAILRADGEPIPDAWVDAIDARIAHRGPDGHGRFRDRVKPRGRPAVEVALVHRRLAVIDPDGGAQPMVSQQGRQPKEGLIAVVFNGCIYNHRELRGKLKAAGHTFVTDHSDTEVLIAGHRQWGNRLQEHLEGMYAYAIWDRKAASLTLARDWFGEKPLYHHVEADGEGVKLLIASSDAQAAAPPPPPPPPESKGLDAPELGRWVRQYLQLGYAWRGRTVSRAGMRVVNVEPSNPFVGGGSDPPSREPADPDEIERLIEQAVARRLEADVPLGCFLSGGVDSSLIAFFAKKHKPDLRTFSVQMPDPRYDESHFAQQVADRLDVDHTTLSVAANPAQDLVKLIRILGQPFGDSSILPTYWVSRAAREHVTVALGGDGGDELFAGYERYLAAPKLARYAQWLSRIPARLGRRAHPKSRLAKLGRLGAMARDFPALGVLATESIFTQPQIDRLLGAAPPEDGFSRDVAAGDEDTLDDWLGVPRWDAGDDAMAALRLADLAGYLPNDLLCKVDTASMAVALEVRCPYLDRDLATALLATPIHRLVPGGQRKGLLRRIARRHLPAEIVDRPKMGFAIPIGRWFHTDFGGMRTLLLDHLRSADPFGPIHLERREVRRLIQEHMSGECDHGQRLFALMTLSIWAGVRS